MGLPAMVAIDKDCAHCTAFGGHPRNNDGRQAFQDIPLSLDNIVKRVKTQIESFDSGDARNG
jgi:hypothetical protein